VQARSEETRTRILRQAVELFAGQGYDATGVAQICKAAQVSKGAFYHHFESKQAVFMNLLEDWLKSVSADLKATLQQAPNVIEGLLNMAGRARSIFSDADGQLSIVLEFWAQARRDPEVWRRAIEPFHMYRQMFSSIVQQGIEEGSLRVVEPALVAQALVSLAVGVIMQGVFDPRAAEWDRVMQGTMKLLIEGIGRR
jgi:AcrR family transcriptional regulator